MTYNKLYYDSLTFDGVEASFGPSFICPRCETRFKDDKTIPTITNVVKDSRKRAFACPKCKATIELYVGIARTEKGEQGIQISVNPIDSVWLEKDIARRQR